jgi:CubicO group peptidase (beta-lactamase class C family)
MKVFLTSVLLLAAFIGIPKLSKAQPLYFPPTVGSAWDTQSPADLQWCTSEIPALNSYLQQTNSRGFVVLKDGKIVIEQYFGSFTRDSSWYWASAGKSLTAFLVGIAKAEGLLSLQDSSSKYLGNGWTSAPANKEGLIKVVHQLSMTSGLNDGAGSADCTDDSCLLYLQDAGTRWAYHNAPYTLLDEVIRSATGLSNNMYVQQKLRPSTGFNGLFLPIGYNQVFFSTPRMMARFGLLMLNQGKWNTTTVLNDTAYFQQMINSSQALNPAYGYLWWLNGKSSYRLPETQFSFPGSLLPNAPMDTYSAMGKNGQLIMVSPSQNLVVVRVGDNPNTGLVPTFYADTLWQYLQAVICSPISVAENQLESRPQAYPNPFINTLSLTETLPNAVYTLYDLAGRVHEQSTFLPLHTAEIAPGLYFLETRTTAFQHRQKVIKQ